MHLLFPRACNYIQDRDSICTLYSLWITVIFQQKIEFQFDLTLYHHYGTSVIIAFKWHPRLSLMLTCPIADYSWEVFFKQLFLTLFLKRYHTPPRSRSCSESDDDDSSETPPHWKEEMQRLRAYRPPSGEKWSKGDK